jgi:hypothetical protein
MSTLPSPIAWERGGTADVVAFEGERLVVLSTTSAAPGTPLHGKVEAGAPPAPPAPPAAQPVCLKVQSCKRMPDGRFTITGRVVSLTRELREALRALLPVA